MKVARVVFIPDGMADVPNEKLGGKTPMDFARTPNMDEMARRGRIGLTHNVPQGMEPGSDVAIMSIMGYDPAGCYTGRGPIEALSIGVDVGPGELAFRCNLINEKDGLLIDYSAGHITTEESAEIVATLNEKLATPTARFHAGVSFRNLLLLKSTEPTPKTFAPHDHMDEPWEKYLPQGGAAADELRALIIESAKILASHPVNLKRIENGKKPANLIWPWSGGATPSMAPFEEKFGLRGAVISAVDLVQGLGRGARMSVIKVPGATGMVDTNYEGKASAAVTALDDHDLVVIHFEGADESGHIGDMDLKIKCIELFDEKIAGPVLRALEKRSDWRAMLLPDHPTPLPIRTHTSEPVPFLVCGSNFEQKNPARAFTEEEAGKTGIVIKNGHELMRLFAADEIYTREVF